MRAHVHGYGAGRVHAHDRRVIAEDDRDAALDELVRGVSRLLRVAGEPDPEVAALGARLLLEALQLREPAVLADLIERGVEAPAVVDQPRDRRVRELVVAHQVPAPHLEAVYPDGAGDRVDRALDGEAGRRTGDAAV